MSRADRSRSATCTRRGAAIIEVLVGFVMLAVAGVGLTTLLGQTSHTMEDVARAERETQAASALLARLGISTQQEFTQMTGVHRRAGFNVGVSAAAPGLYSVTVADTMTGGIILRTTFYVPDSSVVTPP